MGDVEAGEAHAFRRREKLRQRFDAELEDVEIDDLVDAGQALLGRLAHLHGGRLGFLDAGADEAEKHGRA